MPTEQTKMYFHVASSACAVRRLLSRLSISDMRLAVNRFNGRLFWETGVYGDLDGVIDEAGIRLFGVVPEDFSLAASFLKGKSARENSPGMMALSRMAGRLEGEAIPIPDSL